jgi:AcrR family transcriptional regulator
MNNCSDSLLGFPGMAVSRRANALRPRKQPRQARSRDTVHAILRAAAQVFAARGYAATTTNHIAARAGVSIGSLYEYFPSKDALLVALAEAHIAEGAARLDAVWAEVQACGEVREVVRRFARAMFDLHAQDRALHRLLFEEAPLPRRTRQRVAAIEAEIAARLEAYLRARPALTRRDPALAAAVIVQCIEALTHRLVVHGDSDAATGRYVEEMVALVAGYLGDRGG